MFEYILSGFTGSFFSYFCVYWCGVQTYAYAFGNISDRILQKKEIENDRRIRFYERMERKMERMEKKIERIHHQLDQENENHQLKTS